MWNDTYYGGYRTRTFADIFESADNFAAMAEEVDIPLKIKEESLRTLFGLMYARYGNSHVAYSDENQFIYGVFSTIFMYGPTWEKRLEIQDNVRALTLEEAQAGDKTIYNNAYNPGTIPTTEELQAINSQNTTNRKKGKIEAYANILSMLEVDVTREFLDRFKSLFIKILEPDYPLLYETTAAEQLILGGNN